MTRQSPPLRYIPHTDEEIRCMLRRAGRRSLAELFECIPPPLRLPGALNLPEAGSEQEVLARLEALAARNANAADMDCFLGAGCYAHFLPSAVDALVSRAEFTTSYTPYQAEISQGTLQAVFEWQTMLCGLTGLEVANASLYDGASATAEAALMALRITRRRKVVVSAGLHPHTLQVLRTYLRALGAELRVLPAAADGRTAPADLCSDTACLVVQQPGFLGVVEEIAPLAQAAHDAGALCIATHSEALALALLRAPGELGADIACGEAQSFGVPMSFGGPHLGFLAARREFLRQMPGRLVGQTEDAAGKRGFVLTLATREQHIRRERATSNVCTNQGLCLLMATIYLSLLGRRGLAQLARLNLAKAEFAKSLVRQTPGLSLPLSAPTFNEFAVGVPDSAEAALARARSAGCIGGLELSPFAPQLGPALLVCTTELCSRAAIERLVAALAGAAP